jgi:hypothetical protein
VPEQTPACFSQATFVRVVSALSVSPSQSSSLPLQTSASAFAAVVQMIAGPHY